MNGQQYHKYIAHFRMSPIRMALQSCYAYKETTYISARGGTPSWCLAPHEMHEKTGVKLKNLLQCPVPLGSFSIQALWYFGSASL